MPSHYAHYYFGKEVIRVMPDDVKDIINTNETSIDAYMMGLHGPDFLAFYRPWKHNALNREGRRVHQEPGRNFFENASLQLKDHPTSEAYSYIFGCITHFILDASCHPLVTEAITETGLSHAKIEREFDNYILRICRKSPKRVNLRKVFPHSDRIDRLIADFYTGTTPKNTREAIDTMTQVLAIFASKKPSVRKAAYNTLSLIPSKSVKSRRDMIYQDQAEPLAEIGNVKLFDALNKAVMIASREMDHFMDYVLLGTPLNDNFDFNYLGRIPSETASDVESMNK